MSSLTNPLPVLLPELFFGTRFIVRHATTKEDVRKKGKYILPHSSSFGEEKPFAKISIGWSLEGLFIFCASQISFTESFYPKFEQGDSIELFIDTRKTKNGSILHRFCHHFVIMPFPVQGIQSVEITRSMQTDSHSLAPPNELEVETTVQKKGATLEIYLPKEVLHGYDPASAPHIGFAYRLHRAGGTMQSLSLASSIYEIEKNPSLWASLTLQE